MESILPPTNEEAENIPVNEHQPYSVENGTGGDGAATNSAGDKVDTERQDLSLEMCEELLDKYKSIIGVVRAKAKELRDKGLLQQNPDAETVPVLELLKQETKGKSFKAYLNVDGKSFSQPTGADVHRMATPNNVFSHEVELLAPRDDYKCLDISHKLNGLETTILTNKVIGHTQIWCMDLGQVSCEFLNDAEALAEARKYAPTADRVPPFTFRLTLKSYAGSMAIRHINYRAVRRVDNKLNDQLESLQAEITANKDIQMFIGMHGDRDALAFVQNCLWLEAYKIQDFLSSPFEIFFKNAQTLHVGQVQVTTERLEPQRAVTRWANQTQHLMHHIYGSVYDAWEEVENAATLPQQTFKAYAARMYNVPDDEKFLLIIDPAGLHGYLPKVSEPCKIRSSAFKFPEEFSGAKELSQEERKERHRKFVQNVLDVLTASQEVNEIANLIPELAFLGGETILSLLQRVGDDNMESVRDWEDRVYQFFENNPGCLEPEVGKSKSDGGQSRSPGDAGQSVEAGDGASGFLEDNGASSTENNGNNWQSAEVDDSGSPEDNGDNWQSAEVDDSGSPEENDDLWLPAIRQDIIFLDADVKMEVFQVSKRLTSPKDGSVPQLIDVSIPFVDREEKESAHDFVQRLKNSMFEVSITRDTSDRTLRAESFAVNSLVYPKALQGEDSVSEASIAAYQYLLNFRADPNKNINLFEEVPGLQKLVSEKPDSPVWVVEKYNRLEPLKRRAIQSFDALPSRVCIIAGVAGSGKSTLLTTVILGCQFGDCPTNISPAEAPKPDFATLCICPNNESVDKLSLDLQKMYDELEFGDNAPTVLRLYGMESEIGSMTGKGKEPRRYKFDAELAAEHMATFTLADQLSAEYQVVKLTAESFEAAASAEQRKRRLRHMSLHSHALQYLQKHRDKHIYLWTLLDLVDQKRTLTEEEATSFRDATRNLYAEFLGQFQGIICATPAAAGNTTMRNKFKPKLVVVDEAAKMRELSSLIAVAWFSPTAWIMVGDPRQLNPHVALDVQRSNPFRGSLETSILSRAAEVGALGGYLTMNFRQYGDLAILPSALCYLGEMGSQKRYTDAVKHWINHLQKVHPGHPKKSCRLLVELPGSRVGKIGSSTCNKMHARWVMEQVALILQNDTLIGEGKNRGHPVRILLLPLYRAQFRQYELLLNKLKESGTFTPGQMERVRLHTLDSSQGDQEDIVITDLTQSDEPGFTGDLHRICLLLTRAVIGQIVLMDRGMWMCFSEKNVGITERASLLRALYNPMKAGNSVLTIPCCDRCETFNSHKTVDCREQRRKDGQMDTCTKCGDAKRHRGTDETCPRTTRCDNCKDVGHTANECSQEPKCYRCNATDHIASECTIRRQCTVCKAFDHFFYQCPKTESITCNVCGERGHKRVDCPEKAASIECRNCEQLGHLAKDCPEKKKTEKPCHNCKQLGHQMAACPTIQCHNCKDLGHMAPYCTKPKLRRCRTCAEFHAAGPCSGPPVFCTMCGKMGHESDKCRRQNDPQGNPDDHQGNPTWWWYVE